MVDGVELQSLGLGNALDHLSPLLRPSRPQDCPPKQIDPSAAGQNPRNLSYRCERSFSESRARRVPVELRRQRKDDPKVVNALNHGVMNRSIGEIVLHLAQHTEDLLLLLRLGHLRKQRQHGSCLLKLLGLLRRLLLKILSLRLPRGVARAPCIGCLARELVSFLLKTDLNLIGETGFEPAPSSARATPSRRATTKSGPGAAGTAQGLTQEVSAPAGRT